MDSTNTVSEATVNEFTRRDKQYIINYACSCVFVQSGCFNLYAYGLYVCISVFFYTTGGSSFSLQPSRLYFEHILTSASQRCIPVVIVSVKREQSSQTWRSLSLPVLKL